MMPRASLQQIGPWWFPGNRSDRMALVVPLETLQQDSK